MLEVKGLTVHYGKAIALKKISLNVEEKETVSLIGPNGSGKSTLLKTIIGLLKPSSGSIKFDGEEITGLPPYRIVRLGIAYCPERRRLAPDMTVEENLELGAYVRKDREKVRENLNFVYELFPTLKERNKQIAGTLSGGEQQMLAIGRSLMSSPRLLLLDEPTLGLAPIIKKKILETLKEIQKTGLTIFIAEQDALYALKASKRTYVIEHGKIVLQGLSKEVVSQDFIKKSYLG